MSTIRFRSRFLHATVYDFTRAKLDEIGWVTPPVNFGTHPVSFIDYQPEERTQPIAHNTVAVSLGDYESDDEEELGAAVGGVRSAPYIVFVDVYMEEQALAQAICDDVRDIFTDTTVHLVDQITGQTLPNLIEIEFVEGPSRPTGNSADVFRRNWRVMALHTRLYFNSDPT